MSKKLINGLKYEKLAEEELYDLSQWELVDIILAYRKDLKAKKKECDELAYENYELNELFDRLKAENEGFKILHKSDKGLITSIGKQNYQLLQEYDKLKTENDELKKLLKIRIEDLCDSCGASSMMPMPCKVYEKALTEIKEIARVNSINTCWTAINLCADCDEIEECGLQSPFEKLKAIIQIISEVEDA